MKIPYRLQLEDPRWKHYSSIYQRLMGKKCNKCDRRILPLETHHILYRKHLDFLWDYPYDDLECLCWECHIAAHIKKDFRDLALARTFANCGPGYESDFNIRIMEHYPEPWLMEIRCIAWDWEGERMVNKRYEYLRSYYETDVAITLYFMHQGLRLISIRFVDPEMQKWIDFLEEERCERFIERGVKILRAKEVPQPAFIPANNRDAILALQDIRQRFKKNPWKY